MKAIEDFRVRNRLKRKREINGVNNYRKKNSIYNLQTVDILKWELRKGSKKGTKEKKSEILEICKKCNNKGDTE